MSTSHKKKMEDYQSSNRKCKVCGKIISGRYPYCQDCYNTISKNNRSAFEKIEMEWKLEAKEEDVKYFYFVDEMADIMKGRKCMIIGRKGEGKTAIAQKICNQSKYNIFTSILSFKNFPFNEIYSKSNNSFTKPNQYISIWKLIIYTTICKQMASNNNIDSDTVNVLRNVFVKDENKPLDQLLARYTVSDFGFQIMGCGLNIGKTESRDSISWIETIELLENIIKKNIDDSKYYIVFDELDEDYRNFNNDTERSDYFDLITGLFKAVFEIKNFFSQNNLFVYPIVFLRTDIYNLIEYGDKNKWSDEIIRLEWTADKLKKLLEHRLNIVLGTTQKPFSECWQQLFGSDRIRVGNNRGNRMDSFDYILRSTHNRPRDFIQYIKECSKKALTKKRLLIHPTIVKEVDDVFSEYLKAEIIDEIYAVLPEYEEIFAILSQIRKQTFNPDEFVNIYNEEVRNGNLQSRGADKVLKILFDFSVIGNVPSIQTRNIFKYQNESARFNFKEQIIIHRGLYKALQIF